MKQIKGKDAYLEVYSSVAGQFIPFICAESCSINIDDELIDTTTKTTGSWHDYQFRRRNWTIGLTGVSQIVGDTPGRSVFTTIDPAFMGVKQDLRMIFNDSEGNLVQIRGWVTHRTTGIENPYEEFSDFDIEFQGCGNYTLTNSLSGGGSSGGIGVMIIGSTFIIG